MVVPTRRHITDESNLQSRRWEEVNNRPKYIRFCVERRTKAIHGKILVRSDTAAESQDIYFQQRSDTH